MPTKIKCDHKWRPAIEPNNWPKPQTGWYVHCDYCDRWGLQIARWNDDWEEPIEEPILLKEWN